MCVCVLFIQHYFLNSYYFYFNWPKFCLNEAVVAPDAAKSRLKSWWEQLCLWLWVREMHRTAHMHLTQVHVAHLLLCMCCLHTLCPCVRDHMNVLTCFVALASSGPLLPWKWLMTVTVTPPAGGQRGLIRISCWSYLHASHLSVCVRLAMKVWIEPRVNSVTFIQGRGFCFNRAIRTNLNIHCPLGFKSRKAWTLCVFIYWVNGYVLCFFELWITIQGRSSRHTGSLRKQTFWSNLI